MCNWRTGPHPVPNRGPIHLTQQQLDRIANLSRTVVSGVLGDLERHGLIAIGYRALDVLDGDGLKAMLNEG